MTSPATFVPVTRNDVYDIAFTNAQWCTELTELLYPGNAEMKEGHPYGETYNETGTRVDVDRFLEVWRGQSQRLISIFVQRFDPESFGKYAERLVQVHTETGFPLIGIADQFVVAVDWPWDDLRKFLRHLADMRVNAYLTMVMGWVFVVVRRGEVEYYAMWEDEPSLQTKEEGPDGSPE